MNFTLQGLNAYRHYASNIHRQYHNEPHYNRHYEVEDLYTSNSHQYEHYSRYDQPSNSVGPLLKSAWKAYQQYSYDWISPFSNIFNGLSERQDPLGITPMMMLVIAVTGVIVAGAGVAESVRQEDERRRQASLASEVRLLAPLTSLHLTGVAHFLQKFPRICYSKNFANVKFFKYEISEM